ncbi:MAG TPA: serine--tRNA ligase [Rhodospirillales bacterium]
MFDIKWIRDNPEAFDQGMARRGLGPQAAPLIALDAARRQAQTRAQEIQAERNRLSKEIGAAKAKGGDAADMMAAVAKSKDAQAEAEKLAEAAAAELDKALAGLPNIPMDDVPDGKDDTANKQVRAWGDKPKFGFQPKEHFDIGEGLGLMDFQAAAKMSGARFVVLSGALARLERAIANFMLDLHTKEHGLTEVNPPILVKDEALFGTGQLPKFGADLFTTKEGFWLIPTAEVPLTNLVADTIVDEDTLPRRYTALTPCFRSEAGAAGKDTRGMIRQHQFNKVEMVTVSTPETSRDELERMTGCAETVLKRLGLPYRTVVLSTGDMGFGAQKTYDVEVWLPGQDRYREISSCSDCGDFQARRMKARFRSKGEKGTRFVHTLNGSGLAVGRTLIAILENYQRADGSVAVPEALRPYMGGLEAISRNDGKAD